METLGVFSRCVCLVAAVLVCSLSSVNSQDDNFGSGTGVMCDPNNSTVNQCTEANTICFQVNVDSEPECIYDPCKQGTLTNGDCNVNQMCVSAGNCAMWSGSCATIPQYTTHMCVDPCLNSIYCATGSNCEFNALATTPFTCGSSSLTGTSTMADVCSGITCNNLGTCVTLDTGETGSVATAMCNCHAGSYNVNDTFCERQSDSTSVLYQNNVELRVINYPFVAEYNDPNSVEYKEFVQKASTMCNILFGNQPGNLGCSVVGLRAGSVIVTFGLTWDHPTNTEKILAEALMQNLTQRTNVQTGVEENWWGGYLQIDETSIKVSTVSDENPSESSSALLPAVLGSSVAVLVIALAVVFLYYIGRVCRNRYYAGTFDESEDSDTTYQTSVRPSYFYTRNNPVSYNWGYHGVPNYWSPSNSQQQGNIRAPSTDWRWTTRNKTGGVFSAS